MLANACLKAPVRRLRLAAATALAAVDAAEGTKLLAPALRAKEVDSLFAAEALAVLRHPSGKDALREALRHKEPDLRREAARALSALGKADAIAELSGLLESDTAISVQCAAAESLGALGHPGAVPRLLGVLRDEPVVGLVQRRIANAVRRILERDPADPDITQGRAKVLFAYREEQGEEGSARIARLLGLLYGSTPPPPRVEGDAPPSKADPGASVPAAPREPGADGAAAQRVAAGPIADPGDAVKALIEKGLAHPGPRARRAAAWALGRTGADAAIAALAQAMVADADELVRFHALRGYARWKSAKEDGPLANLLKVLRYDVSALVREEAAVKLGVAGVEGARDGLAAAAKQDPAWEVVVAACVSLGKTRDPRAVEPLGALLSHKDWRVRGAAAAGLGWTRQATAMPLLVQCMSDADTSVVRTAWEFLQTHTGKQLPLRAKDWQDWWAANGAGFDLVDREAEIRDARKHGYAVRDRDVYDGLDVVVLDSRGDSIQELLASLEIRHRMTRSKGVKADGLQPLGVFVSNCTGEMQPEDHERVQWFVHAGGALFGSCWAIDKTIGLEFPNTIRKYPKAMGQVLDQVRAEALPTDSAYLDGVFPGVTRPMYELYGAFLVEVLDPERCEVLIDSPECANRWNGGGDLAAWFTAGHGVVLGSSNHFDRQKIGKLGSAKWVSVKSEEDRMAFAVDHFGFPYDRIRELRAKGVFAKQPETEKVVFDLSAFRFVTNFVRRKRLVDI
jgi:HEAT repeat protein